MRASEAGEATVTCPSSARAASERSAMALPTSCSMPPTKARSAPGSWRSVARLEAVRATTAEW